jgi:sugar lactone lactonase YvrE
LQDLSKPRYLCTSGSRVFISDWYRNILFTVDFHSGVLLDKLQFLATPFQICLDEKGNIFIVSNYAGRVLVRSPTGKLKVLLEEESNRPRGVCVTPDGILLVAWDTRHLNTNSVVVGYQFQ